MLISAVGEGLCLDFANTRSWRGSDQPSEKLESFGDLTAWLEQSAGIDDEAARAIAAWADRHSEASTQLLAETIALREAMYRMFVGLVNGTGARRADLGAVTGALAAAPGRSRLVRAGAGYAWSVDAPVPASVPHLLAPVLWSAGDLALAAPRRRIRQCANGACLWLFLDASRTGTRRWCDMASCGNRAKARRHYLRRTAA
jgi:predicted RNA-binding Zn ribbon-like protein